MPWSSMTVGSMTVGSMTVGIATVGATVWIMMFVAVNPFLWIVRAGVADSTC